MIGTWPLTAALFTGLCIQPEVRLLFALDRDGHGGVGRQRAIERAQLQDIGPRHVECRRRRRLIGVVKRDRARPGDHGPRRGQRVVRQTVVGCSAA